MFCFLVTERSSMMIMDELSLRSPAPSLAVITLYGVAVQYWEEGGGNNPKSLSLKRRQWGGKVIRPSSTASKAC